MKIVRCKKFWVDIELDWSNFLVGFDVDRYHSGWYDEGRHTSVVLYLGPITFIFDY